MEALAVMSDRSGNRQQPLNCQTRRTQSRHISRDKLIHMSNASTRLLQCKWCQSPGLMVACGAGRWICDREVVGSTAHQVVTTWVGDCLQSADT